MATGPHDFSNAETRPTRVIRAREGWGGCFTIGFSLLGVILCVGVALGVIAATRWPRMLDRYLSLEPGNASLYRVTYGNGVTGFLSANTVKPNRDSITYAAVQGQGGDAVQVHTIATNWDGQIGQIHNRDDMYALESDSLVLIAQREDGTTTEFLPPLLTWSPNLLETTPSQPLAGQVAFNDTRFDYKLWLDGRETVT
ncbi:MAG TPA: hypothetical protein VI451_08770, partial [Anaerolineales bacterium]|nr:hypothetical protein [Anaerolineales bacterium]